MQRTVHARKRPGSGSGVSSAGGGSAAQLCSARSATGLRRTRPYRAPRHNTTGTPDRTGRPAGGVNRGRLVPGSLPRPLRRSPARSELGRLRGQAPTAAIGAASSAAWRPRSTKPGRPRSTSPTSSGSPQSRCEERRNRKHPDRICRTTVPGGEERGPLASISSAISSLVTS